MGIRAKKRPEARVSGLESSYTSPTEAGGGGGGKAKRKPRQFQSLQPVYRKGDHFADAFSAQRQHDHAVNAQRHAGAVRQTRLQRRQQVVIDGLLREGRARRVCGYPAQTAGAVHGRRSARGNRSPAQYLCNRPQSAQRPDDLPG